MTILTNKRPWKKRETPANTEPRQGTPLQNWAGDLFSSMGTGVDPKELLKPSTSVRDAFTRTFFHDDEELKDIVLLISQFNEFGFDKDDEGKEFYDRLCYLLDGFGSIGGMRIKEYLQAMAKVVVSEDTEISAAYRAGGNGHKKPKLKQIKGKDEEEEEE